MEGWGGVQDRINQENYLILKMAHFSGQRLVLIADGFPIW